MMHDMRFTMLNCMLVQAYQSPNCSFLASSNIIDSMKQLKQTCAIISISFAASSFSGSGLPQCLPRDRLEMASAEPENATTLQSGIYFDEKERLVYCL